MINASHLREGVIRPTLQHMGVHTRAAEELVLGTACVESACGEYLRQLGGGPALGIYQMEPATHEDIWNNYLAYRSRFYTAIEYLLAREPDREMQLVGNLAYATAMCRVHYLRVPEALPAPGDIEGQAHYWKAHYNTHKGAGTVEDYIHSWYRYAGD